MQKIIFSHKILLIGTQKKSENSSLAGEDRSMAFGEEGNTHEMICARLNSRALND